MSEIKIKKISYLDTFSIRNEILRPGKPIETCFFLGDDHKETIHFGLFKDKKLIGVASCFKVNNDNFKETIQFQLRGMAVLTNYQGSGYGRIFLQEICRLVQKESADLLWFNAREAAVGFYKRLGFSILGDAFEISEIGTHFVMCKYFVVKNSSFIDKI